MQRTVSKRDFFDFRKLRQRSPNCKPGCITFSPQRLLRKWKIFTCHICESGVPFSLRIMLKLGTNWIRIGYKLGTNLVRIGYKLGTNLVQIGYKLDTNWVRFGTNWVQIVCKLGKIYRLLGEKSFEYFKSTFIFLYVTKN
jgi:hypothetical protein